MKPKGSKPSGGTRPIVGRPMTYKGHDILLPEDERSTRVFIDGRPVYYGIAGGTYYLDVYAYDPADSLEEVIKRYLDYKDQAHRAGREE